MAKLPSNSVDLVLSLATSCVDSERIERKYVLGHGQRFWVRPHLANAGFFSQHADRKIQSVYYDTADYACARANIDGLRYRLKFRLRFYNDNPETAVLETKIKSGFLGYKLVTCPTELKNATTLDDKVRVAATYFSRMIDEPVFTAANISYHRAYLANTCGVRATMDSRITGKKYLGKKGRISRFSNYEVAEFKYQTVMDQAFREDIHPLLAGLNVRMTKCSKYVRAVA